MNTQPTKPVASYVQLGMKARDLGLSLKVCKRLSVLKKQMFMYGYAIAA